MFTERTLMKYFEILKFIEAGFELIEKDNVVYVRKGKRKIAVLDLGCPEAQFVWKMLKKEVSVDEVADMIEALETTKRNYKKRIYKQRREEKKERLLESYIRKYLRNNDIISLKYICMNDLFFDLRRDEVVDVMKKVASELNAKLVFLELFDDIVLLSSDFKFYRPYRRASNKKIFFTNYCYNPPIFFNNKKLRGEIYGIDKYFAVYSISF